MSLVSTSDFFKKSLKRRRLLASSLAPWNARRASGTALGLLEQSLRLYLERALAHMEQSLRLYLERARMER